MSSIIPIVRWIHILAGAGWFGEVITIVFVLLPWIQKNRSDDQVRLLQVVFPRLFRTASVLSLTSIAAGVTLHYLKTGWQQLDAYVRSPHGFAIVLGGSLGLVLTSFRFLVENRLESRLKALGDGPNPPELGPILRFLRIAPRVGLVVMLSIFLLMMYGARGL